MKFGAHISGGGTLLGTIEKAKKLQVDCLQIFASPPSNWNNPKHTNEEMAQFKQLIEDNELGPNFFHAIYLLNLGSDNDELYEKSIQSLTRYLTIAPQMGILGAIFHTGSHKGAGFDAVKKRVGDAFNRILAETPKESYLIIENNAGQGNLIAKDTHEIAQLIELVKKKDRIAVCLDTCHAFANGMDWREIVQVNEFVANLDREIGWEHVVAVHANDSKFEIGMNKDRHENIGEGFIGERGFRNILTHPQFQHLPFLLETPGFEANGPDGKNLQRLRDYSKPILGDFERPV